ncbi:RtcB family protein, partial [Candidatus Woesearchaeota archaeon]|nr:RtcB family protein [Candidatus Woesearchaeota archaeon]
MEIRKISEHEWELPKTAGMHVPARIFATEKLIEKIKQDRTLQQAANVAHLKGIQKYSYVMPDAHEGYGFPIGGVAAFDIEEGIISPGGIGYDVNCITGDSEILSPLGHHRKIREFHHLFSENIGRNTSLLLLQQGPTVSSLEGTEIKEKEAQFFIEKPDPQEIFEITTELGFRLKATGDHPFLTDSGMQPLTDLKKGSTVAIHPFSGIPFEEPDATTIVDASSVPGAVRNELEKRGLLPLKQNSKATPYLAKILGYITGDGLVYFTRNKGHVHAYGSKEDLETMSDDIKKIGYSARIYARTRSHKITSQYGTREFLSTAYELHCPSTSLATLMTIIGMPLGRKTASQHTVPEWIKNSKSWIKRLYLAGLFGAELSTPSTLSKTGFYSPVISKNKEKPHLEAGRKFLIDIMLLLEQLGVKCTRISQRKEHPNKQNDVYRLRLAISSEETNLLKLFRTIGFEYNKKLSLFANIATVYILRKKTLQQKRTEISLKAKELRKKGLKLVEAKKILACDEANERFIYSFKRYVSEALIQMQSGFLTDKVKEIRRLETKEKVYDFTIQDSHNFIANGLIVSNCGVRLVKTDFTAEEILPKRTQLLNELFNEIPSGVGKGGITKLSKDELLELLEKGSEWSLEHGYGTKEDLETTEEKGRMKQAEPNTVSERALARGKPQLGTLGAGNHFLEIQKIDEIYDEEAADALGLQKGKTTVMIHCGSRGLGHQIATDYIQQMERRFGYEHLPDRELVNAPLNSELGQKYFKAMCAGMNYAFANRQMIAHWVRDSFKKVLGTDQGMKQVYDVCHNIAKLETHKVDGERKKVCVHRKGATRAFGPGHDDVPERYRKIGQPVLIPGSMGTASYVLLGTRSAEDISFSSSAHGAGRELSRAAAIRQFRGETVAK